MCLFYISENDTVSKFLKYAKSTLSFCISYAPCQCPYSDDHCLGLSLECLLFLCLNDYSGEKIQWLVMNISLLFPKLLFILHAT